MKMRTLFSLGLTMLAAPLYAEEPGTPLHLLQQISSEPQAKASVRSRARHFSALGGLPASTDSFLAISRVGELLSMAQVSSGFMPGLELAAELDSLAIGVTPQTVADLQRLQPLFQALTSAEQLTGSWVEKANDEAARAIVGVQREQSAADAGQLVQATKNFHLAPIYVVLTAREGGQGLLQQMSMLPLMLPMTSDMPIGVTVHNSWRGFCIYGNRLDLSSAGLEPEQESAIRANLEKAELYVLASMVGKRLVFVICSNLDEVESPSRHADSLLAAPVMQAFDASLARKPWAIGYSSPAVVALREEENLLSCRKMAGLMERIFSRLGQQNSVCAAAAQAIQSLQELSSRILPQQCSAERMVLWGEKDLYLQMTGTAGPLRFAPGQIRYAHRATAADMAFYAESTPLQGLPEVPVSAVLDDVEAVQAGYLSTLKEPHASETKETLACWQQHRSLVEQVAGVASEMNARTMSSGAMLLSACEAGASAPFSFTLRAELTDAPALAEQLRNVCQSALGSVGPVVSTQGNELVLHYGGAAVEPVPAAVPVQGGSVFSLNLPVLSRVLPHDGLGQLSTWIERIEGAACTLGNESHTLLHVILNDDK